MSVYLNKKDMAASLRISVQAFDKWNVEAVERRGREAFYDVRTVLDNRLLYQEQAKKNDSEDDEREDADIDFERFRLTRAQADAQELKNEKERGEVVESAFSVFVLSRIAAEIAGILDGIPLTLQRRFPELETRHIEFLRLDVVKAMNKASALGEMVPELLNEYIEKTTG